MSRGRARNGAHTAPTSIGQAPWADRVLTDDERARARELMQLARSEAVRDERYPYLASGLSSMLLVERIGLGTVACDVRWRMYYDPARVLYLHEKYRGAKVLPVLISDWVHELMHLLREHPQRWVDINEPPENHPIFNIAGDAHVNRDCAQMGLPILDSDVTFDRLPPHAGCEPTMTTEEVYIRLRRLVKPSSPDGTPEEGRHGHGRGYGDCGSGTGGAARPWEESADDGSDGSVDSGRAAIIREQVAEAVKEAAKHAGSRPGQFLRDWADALLEPSVDWRRELRSVVSRRIGSSAGVLDYSFARRSRRRVPGFFLPGTVGAAPPHIAAVIDTSGSMGPDDLTICLSDLLGLARTADRDQPAIDVLACDAQVHAVTRVRRPSDVARVQLRGGGGTDMVAAIHAAAALTPTPQVVVVMTDGYTPWPASPPPALAGALVIALITTPPGRLADVVDDIPAWMRTITTHPVPVPSRS